MIISIHLNPITKYSTNWGQRKSNQIIIKEDRQNQMFRVKTKLNVGENVLD